MEISQYWVGQIPQRPISIQVRDSRGLPVNLSSYEDFNAILLGSDNEEIDLTGSELSTAGAISGRFVFRFPTNRSLFEKSGEYLLQLEFAGSGTRDFTTVHYMKVKELGGVN